MQSRTEAYPQTPADSAALLAERRASTQAEPLTVFYPYTGEYVSLPSDPEVRA